MAQASWKSAIVAGATLAVVLAAPAKAQFTIPGLTFQQELTPAQQNQQVVPYKRALTTCVIKQALADSGAPLAYRDGSFDAYVATLINQCPEERQSLAQVYNQTYGQGQAAPFINGAYAADLPRAVLRRIKPQLEAKVEQLKQEEAEQAAKDAQLAQQRADEERAAEARRQEAAAEAESEAQKARADADRAKSLERAAAQQAEAERLKQVEIANGAAKLLAGKALDCGRDQLKALVKSGENAEVLASAVMTMCDTDVDHFVEAGVKEYNLEHEMKDDDPADGLLREKLKSETRDRLVALAVQAKAGVGAFAPTSSN